jgi:hypothetical protein
MGLVFHGIFRTLHGGGPVSIRLSLPFRSPISKLLRFFCRSRDKWKAKCKAAKRENKSLKYRLAVMTENRNRWKAEVRDLRKSLQVETIPFEPKTKNTPTKKHATHGSRGRRCRPARVGVGSAR